MVAHHVTCAGVQITEEAFDFLDGYSEHEETLTLYSESTISGSGSSTTGGRHHQTSSTSDGTSSSSSSSSSRPNTTLSGSWIPASPQVPVLSLRKPEVWTGSSSAEGYCCHLPENPVISGDDYSMQQQHGDFRLIDAWKDFLRILAFR